MRWITAVLLFLTLGFTTPSRAVIDDTPIFRENWIQQFQTEFQQEFCAPENFVVKCHNYTQKKCESDVLQNFPKCAGLARLPATIYSTQESYLLGKEIGTCLGQKVTSQLKETLPLSGCEVRP